MEELLNQFFAERILQNGSSEQLLFLSNLMGLSREGHLCWKEQKDPLLPSFIIEEGTNLLPKTPLVKQGDRYYLQKNWVYETHILEQVRRLLGYQPVAHDTSCFERELASADLLPLQKKAVEQAFHSAFSLICGGPGTGKTYTARFLVRLLLASKKKEKYRVILAAPTGKAASHLQSVIGENIEATTLHRLLQIKPGKNSLFSPQWIDADLVIVDEASMVDVPLLAQLLESVGPETRLVLMGDPDQLPPVEAGSIFADMADLLAIRLTECKRTDVASLQQLAQGIQRGEWKGECRLAWNFNETLGSKIFEAVEPCISWEPIDPLRSLEQLNRFRVLGALRQGPFGVEALNRHIVEEMGRRIQPGQWWAIPLMISVNEPRLDLYNGTCGVLVGKSRGAGIHLQEGIAYFPQAVPWGHLPSFEVAFCLSIHKSQGSEFGEVLALFPPGSERFGKEAVYTAVTRAKERVQIVVDPEIMEKLLLKSSRRYAGFTERFTTPRVEQLGAQKII